MVNYRTVTLPDGFTYEQVVRPTQSIFPTATALGLTALAAHRIIPTVRSIRRTVKSAFNSFSFKKNFSKKSPIKTHTQQYHAHKEQQSLFKEIHEALNKPGKYKYQQFKTVGPAPQFDISRQSKIRFRSKNNRIKKSTKMARSYKRSRGRYRKKRSFRKPTYSRSQRPEKKYHDYEFRLEASSDATTTAGIEPLNNQIRSGSAQYERIGNRTQMLYLKINGYTIFEPISDRLDRSRWIRMFLILDKQPTGSLMSISDILKQSNAGGSTANPEISHFNVDNQQRFKVLLSKKLDLTQVSAVHKIEDIDNDILIAQYRGRGFSYYVRVPPAYSMSTYKASTGAISDVSSGLLYMVVVSQGANSNDSVTGFPDHPSLQINTRMCYYG